MRGLGGVLVAVAGAVALLVHGRAETIRRRTLLRRLPSMDPLQSGRSHGDGWTCFAATGSVSCRARGMQGLRGSGSLALLRRIDTLARITCCDLCALPHRAGLRDNVRSAPRAGSGPVDPNGVQLARRQGGRGERRGAGYQSQEAQRINAPHSHVPSGTTAQSSTSGGLIFSAESSGLLRNGLPSRD